MQINQANLIHLYKNDEVVCLPFEKNELLNNKHSNYKIKAIGNNQKKILIMVSHSINDLNSEENVLLFNILKAIHLTIEDVKLVEFAGQPFKFIKNSIEFEKCILLGLDGSQIGLQMALNPYHIFNFMNTFFLTSHSANLLNKHKKYKENLWKALQKMFAVT